MSKKYKARWPMTFGTDGESVGTVITIYEVMTQINAKYRLLLEGFRLEMRFCFDAAGTILSFAWTSREIAA